MNKYVAPFLFVSLVACGDNDNKNNVDAAPQPDAAPTFKGFDADEGGEVRAEYVRFANLNAAARVTGFVYKDVGTVKYHEYLNLNGCTDMRDKTKWPMAQNANRTYADPGGIKITGGPMALDVERRAMMANDPFGRTHPANEWFFHFPGATGTDGPTYLPAKTRFDVEFAGSADMPKQTFEDVLYMPDDFALTPAPPTPIPPEAIPAGQAKTFTWQVSTDTANPPSSEYRIDSLVAFTGANGPAVICIEPNDGSVTVPAAMIDVARAAYPTGGTLARQTLTHVVRELKDNNGPTGRRIDFISVWCYATSFTVP